MTSSEDYPQFLGNAGVVHYPIFDINFTVGSFLMASLVSHLGRCEGAFLVAALRESQYTSGLYLSRKVSNLFHQYKMGFLKVELSIFPSRLVLTLSPSAIFLFPFWVCGGIFKEYPVLVLDIMRPCMVIARALV